MALHVGLAWPGYGFANRHLGFNAITDGTSNTIAACETTYNYRDYLWGSTAGSLAGSQRWGTARWVVGYPRISLGTTRFPINDFSVATMEGYSSQHAGDGVNLLLMDGSVRFIPATIDMALFDSLSTRAGGEISALEQ